MVLKINQLCRIFLNTSPDGYAVVKNIQKALTARILKRASEPFGCWLIHYRAHCPDEAEDTLMRRMKYLLNFGMFAFGGENVTRGNLKNLIVDKPSPITVGTPTHITHHSQLWPMSDYAIRNLGYANS